MIPNPWRITFDTNPDDCNLHCIMCEEHSPLSPKQAERKAAGRARRRMDFAIIEQVLGELKDVPPKEIIPSTMGEPLLYRDFERILGLCRSYGIRLNLTTNGTFPGHGATAWAEQIVPIGSDVKISLNGVRSETQAKVMCGSSLETALANAREFIRVRDAVAARGGNYCSVTFQVTYMKMNIDELPDLVRLAAEMGIDRVKGHHLWAHFADLKPLSMRNDPSAVAHFNEVAKRAQHAARSFPRPNAKPVRLENMFAVSETASGEIAPGALCPFLGQEAWVNWEGRFDPCCAPDELRKSLGDFGNVKTHGFLPIWRGGMYRRLCEDYESRELCRTCVMRRPPAGGTA